MKRVPLSDLRRGGEALDAELTAAFRRVLESGTYILGPEVDAFEAECASLLGVEHAIGVSSGTDALLVVLMALEIGPGDEVVCPTYTFFATAGAIARVGATPVFVDSELESYNIDPDAMARAIGPRTKAILPVHLFGRCADMTRIRSIAGSIPIIEDAAQAILADHEGAQAGRLGRAGCFSFFPAKNLGALGDAGLVTTDDAALAERIRHLRVHGGHPKYVHHYVGGNFRIDALQAALLRVKLPHLSRATERRREHAAFYANALRDTPIALPREGRGRHVYNQFVVRVPDRDRVQRELEMRGIGTAVYYPRPLHLQKCFAALGHRQGSFPIAEQLSRETLAIPMFPDLEDDERERVVAALRDAVQSGRSGT